MNIFFYQNDTITKLYKMSQAIRMLVGVVSGGLFTAMTGLTAYGLKTCYMPAPTPKTALEVLGGTVKTAVKGVGSLPLAKEGLIAVATLATAYGLTRSRRVRATMDDGVWRLKERLGFRLKERTSPRADQVIPESVRNDSVELDMAMPKVQVKVGHVKNGEFIVFGSAVRICDAIVVPAHVLNSSQDDGFIYLKGTQGVLRLAIESFEIIETDLMARQTQSDEFSRIGMPQVRLSECLTDVGEFVSICGVRGQGTVGKIKHDVTSFGKVVYYGTTMPGYSGAPYMVGGSVIGIHCWGGKVNGGYSASYVKVLIQKQLGRVEETFTWLEGKMKQKAFKKTDIRFNPGNDEAWIRYKGQYHVVSGDDFRKANGFQYIEDFENHDSTRVAEALLNSGESLSRSGPGASGSVNQSGELESQIRKVLTQTLKELSSKRRKQVMDSAASLSQEAGTSGLLSEPRPN